MGIGVSLFLIGVGAVVAVPMHAITGATSTVVIGLVMIAVGALALWADRYVLAPPGNASQIAEAPPSVATTPVPDALAGRTV